MERGFIEFARAATLIVETIPAHRDYATELNGEQKANLTANRFRLPSSESAVSTSPCGAPLRARLRLRTFCAPHAVYTLAALYVERRYMLPTVDGM
ncbi:hypothetical protein K438DRAFT_1861182, partial [Mycena galopus ATCC 62051]